MCGDYGIAYSCMGIASSSLASGPFFFFLLQQAATPLNIVAGVIEMVR